MVVRPTPWYGSDHGLGGHGPVTNTYDDVVQKALEVTCNSDGFSGEPKSESRKATRWDGSQRRPRVVRKLQSCSRSETCLTDDQQVERMVYARTRDKVQPPIILLAWPCLEMFTVWGFESMLFHYSFTGRAFECEQTGTTR